MSGPSAEELAEIEALARSFARHLEHLHEFRGVHYVGAAPTPRTIAGAELDGSERAPAPEPSVARERPEPAASEAASAPRPQPQQSTYSQPIHTQSPDPSNRAPSRPSAPAPEPARARARAQTWSAARKLSYLRERNVGDCRRCVLAKTRRNIVFGVGDPEADLMFIGEAPGADEDRRGEPFVGAAGRRLDRWIHELGLTREQVYIANVLKCRPPGNRDPRPEEIERCSPFVHAQIRAIEPKVLVALGRFAGCLLIGRDQKMYEMRGQLHHYREPKTGAQFPVVVTYHPSYVIRREREPPRPDRGGAIKSEDEKVLTDLQRALSLVRGGGG